MITIKKRKKRIKPAFRRLIITGPLCLFLILYSIYTISSYVLKIYTLNQEQKHLEERLTSLVETKEVLESELVKLKDPDYLAKYARENYLYSKDGEYIIKIEETSNQLEEVKGKYNKTVIVFTISVVTFLFLAILLLPSKKKQKVEDRKKR